MELEGILRPQQDFERRIVVDNHSIWSARENQGRSEYGCRPGNLMIVIYVI